MVDYIIIFSTIFIIIYLTHYLYGYFQQEHYHPFKMLKHFKLYYFELTQVFLLIGIYTIFLLYLITNMWYWIIFLLFFYLGLYYKTSKNFIKTKYTKRTIRYFIIYYVLITFVLLTSIIHKDIYVVLILLVNPAIFLINFYILYPLEKLINKRYVKKAYQKLNKIGARKIAVVGSYGKTSTKNFLDTLLSTKYFVKTSKNSVNTLMGITKMINEDIKIYDDVLLFELAATHKNDINDLTNLVEPEIVILTGITYQHTSTFKTIENIVNEKMKVLTSKSLKAVIINDDCEYLKNYNYPKHLKLIRCSIKNSDCEYYYDGDFIYHKQINLANIKPNIYGDGNKSNYLLAVVTSLYLDIDIEMIKDKSTLLKPAPHRLEVRKKDNLIIVDNSYSSNIVGFENSLKFLKEHKELKVIITPGIVDLGKYTKMINERVASMLLDIDVILIKNESSVYISNYLDEHKKEYKMFNSFKEAYSFVVGHYQEAIVLIENDLPENYLRG